MPDRRIRCDRGCHRCWANKLTHGCKQAKAYLIKHGRRDDFRVEGPQPWDTWSENYKQQKDRERERLKNKQIKREQLIERKLCKTLNFLQKHEEIYSVKTQHQLMAQLNHYQTDHPLLTGWERKHYGTIIAPISKDQI
jgi:hypothetical protein